MMDRAELARRALAVCPFLPAEDVAAWSDDEAEEVAAWLDSAELVLAGGMGARDVSAPRPIIQARRRLSLQIRAERASEDAELAEAARVFIRSGQAARDAEIRLGRAVAAIRRGRDQPLPLVVDHHLVDRAGDRFVARPVWIARRVIGPEVPGPGDA